MWRYPSSSGGLQTVYVVSHTGDVVVCTLHLGCRDRNHCGCYFSSAYESLADNNYSGYCLAMILIVYKLVKK